MAACHQQKWRETDRGASEWGMSWNRTYKLTGFFVCLSDKLREQLGEFGKVEHQSIRPDCAIVVLPTQKRFAEMDMVYISS